MVGKTGYGYDETQCKHILLYLELHEKTRTVNQVRTNNKFPESIFSDTEDKLWRRARCANEFRFIQIVSIIILV
jgi:hypothetical protein